MQERGQDEASPVEDLASPRTTNEARCTSPKPCTSLFLPVQRPRTSMAGHGRLPSMPQSLKKTPKTENPLSLLCYPMPSDSETVSGAPVPASSRSSAMHLGGWEVLGGRLKMTLTYGSQIVSGRRGRRG